MEIVLDHSQTLAITNDIVMAWYYVEADVILLTVKPISRYYQRRLTIKKETYHPSTFNRVSKILESRDSLQI